MKTAEDILKKHNGPCKYYTGLVQMVPFDVAISAMKEYASQSLPSISEEEIKIPVGSTADTKLNLNSYGSTADNKILSQHLKDLAPTDKEIKGVFASKNFITNVCLSYRHDFGLMDENQQSNLAFECREWMRAIVNNWPYHEKLTGLTKKDGAEENKQSLNEEIARIANRRDDGCWNCSVKDCKIFSSGKKCGNWTCKQDGCWNCKAGHCKLSKSLSMRDEKDRRCGSWTNEI